jgi:GNAT superfamily N-acetyltransferase
MRDEHLDAVARLHVLRLSQDFRGWAGRRIARLLYREIIRSRQPPPAFVATQGGAVVGFAIAVEDAAAMRRRVLLKCGWQLAPLAVAQFLFHPSSLVGRAVRGLAARRASERTDLDEAFERCCPMPRVEFRGIAVEPQVRLPGVPLALMRARLAWAKEAGYRSVFFRIDPGNEASLRLSQWAGAKPVPGGADRGGMLRFYIDLA